jgi:2-haloacid dehalogenase
MYDIVLLDADMTIWDFEASEKLALADTIESVGGDMTEEVFAFYHKINSALWKAFDQKQVTKEELSFRRFDKLLKFLGKEGEPMALNQYYQQRLGAHSIMLPGAEDMCRTLAERCTLYILTNGMHTAQVGRFEKSPIKVYINDMFISEDMGCQKPDKEYYDKVFALIGLVDKSRAVMVGDSLTSDIRGGINAGMRTCWVNPKGKIAPPENRPDYEIESITQLTDLLKNL